jgi:O-antigen ligase
MLAVLGGIYFYLSAKLIGKQTQRIKTGLAKWIIRVATGLVVLALGGGLVVAAGWMLSNFDERMTYLLRVLTRLEEFRYFYPNEAIFALADRLAFAERLAYWTVGLRTFGLYPILGVGIGNSGFFFKQHLPAFARQLTELRNVLSVAEFGFPNVKNLWLRLLAEGGLFGFASFTSWYVLISLGAALLSGSNKKPLAVLGLGGIIGSITFFFEGFSLDTYALPHYWILFGLVTCALGGWLQTTEKDHEKNVLGEGDY